MIPFLMVLAALTKFIEDIGRDEAAKEADDRITFLVNSLLFMA